MVKRGAIKQYQQTTNHEAKHLIKIDEVRGQQSESKQMSHEAQHLNTSTEKKATVNTRICLGSNRRKEGHTTYSILQEHACCAEVFAETT